MLSRRFKRKVLNFLVDYHLYKEKKRPMKVCLWEQLKEVDETLGKRQKIQKLRLYKNPQLLTVLELFFNPKVKIEVLPDIKYNPSRDSENALVYRLYQESSKLKNLTNVGPYPNLDIRKRTQLLISTLETLHPKDAELLLAAVHKQMPFENINEKLIINAFPELKEAWNLVSEPAEK